jgi:hypothetical protein
VCACVRACIHVYVYDVSVRRKTCVTGACEQTDMFVRPDMFESMCASLEPIVLTSFELIPGALLLQTSTYARIHMSTKHKPMYINIYFTRRCAYISDLLASNEFLWRTNLAISSSLEPFASS